MSYRLIRGFPLDRVVDAYRRLGPDEEPERMIRGKYLVDLRPVENSRSTLATRKKSTLQKASCTFQRLHDYGETYYLVVRAERKWAPPNERQNFGVVVSMAAGRAQVVPLTPRKGQTCRADQSQRIVAAITFKSLGVPETLATRLDELVDPTASKSVACGFRKHLFLE